MQEIADGLFREVPADDGSLPAADRGPGYSKEPKLVSIPTSSLGFPFLYNLFRENHYLNLNLLRSVDLREDPPFPPTVFVCAKAPVDGKVAIEDHDLSWCVYLLESVSPQSEPRTPTPYAFTYPVLFHDAEPFPSKG